MPYLSDLQHRRVIGPSGDGVGRLLDVAVMPREQLPVVQWGILGTGGGERVIRWTEAVIEPAHIRLRHRLDGLAPESLTEGALRLGRDLLDQPIRETQGAKVVRVNDLQLEETGGQLRLVGADVGARGLLRRIGVEGLADGLARVVGRRLGRRILPWHLVELIEGPVTGQRGAGPSDAEHDPGEREVDHEPGPVHQRGDERSGSDRRVNA